MSAFSDSRLTSHGAVAQLSYELPHRIHTAVTYPVRAPNGSTIIIYGHSYGIKIIWRGGRSFRRDDSQLIGSANADEKNAPANANADHGSDEEDTESSGHFPIIVHDEDLCLGTGVLQITVPDFRCISGATVQATTPPIFRQKIVCAVACEDNTIRTIAIPLEPPSSLSDAEASTWGEEIAVMGGVHGHQAIPNAISMTWTLRNSEDDSHGARSGRHDTRSRDFQIVDLEKEECDLVLASHSSQVSGVILFARVAIRRVDKATSTIDTSSVFPFQTVYLRGPARQIGFNPMPYPSPRHSHLLVAEIQGPTRVFDPFRSRHTSSSSSSSSSSQQARNSSANTNTNGFNQGAWLATFFPSYDIAQVLDDTASKRNRYILDAQWTCSGREIVGLFADGEWGVWDFEALMNGSSNALQQQQQQEQRGQPMIPTHFAIRGYVGLNISSSSSSTSMTTNENPLPSSRNTRTNDRSSSSSLLAPMTPNTRREKGGRVFSTLPGAEPSSNNNSNSTFSSSTTALATMTIPPRGSISISRVGPSNYYNYNYSNKYNAGANINASNRNPENQNQTGKKTETIISSSSSSSIDSSVLIHYAGKFYNVASLRALLRQHCFSNNNNNNYNDNNNNKSRRTSGGVGSLYGPSLTRLQGLNFRISGGDDSATGAGQQILTSVHHLHPTPIFFPTTKSSPSRDLRDLRDLRESSNSELLITAEYRLIFYHDPALTVATATTAMTIAAMEGGGGGAAAAAAAAYGSLYSGIGDDMNDETRRRRRRRRRRRIERGGAGAGELGGYGPHDDDDDDDDDDVENENENENHIDRMDIGYMDMDKTIDQHLLSRGQLDLNGVSRLLDDMTDDRGSAAGADGGADDNGRNLNKRVGFAA